MLRPGLAHIRELLQSNRLIRGHLEQRDRELALFGMALGRLPDALRRHCRDAMFSEGVLTLFVDSPAWATRARFVIDELTRSLRSEGVVKVVTQVRVESSEVSVPKPNSRAKGGPGKNRNIDGRLSNRAVAHILEAAEAMSDPMLADVFRRLADRHSGSDGDDATRPPDAGAPPGPRRD
jgi:hypothetical protein